MDLVPLIDAAEHIPLLADAYRRAWAPYYVDGPGDAEADLHAACRDASDGLPYAIVALEDGAPVGVVALRTDSPGSERHPGVWVAGLLVLPAARGRGVAARLVAAAVDAARSRGVEQVFVSTEVEGLVAGWERIDEAATLRGTVPVYRLRL